MQAIMFNLFEHLNFENKCLNRKLTYFISWLHEYAMQKFKINHFKLANYDKMINNTEMYTF